MTDLPRQLVHCPVCHGESFERRYWFGYGPTALLRRKAPWGRKAKESVDWLVCNDCGHILPFLRS